MAPLANDVFPFRSPPSVDGEPIGNCQPTAATEATQGNPGERQTG